MHYEFLVEDVSGKKQVEEIIYKILDLSANTFRIHCYKGIGRIPKNLASDPHPRHRFLLTQLPKLLEGHGKTFAGYGEGYEACVVVVCDLDKRDLGGFLAELNGVLENCYTPPITRFCIAVEEGEAWLLGDLTAIKTAYPHAKDAVLAAYQPDSICGTWETLAEAIYPGGAEALSRLSYREIGAAKFDWASNITPHIDVETNASPSFHHFVRRVQDLASA